MNNEAISVAFEQRASSPILSGTDTRLARYLQLADRLRAEIISSKMAAGQRLPSEAELARQHDVAVGTVRQAISLLADERLVERRQGRGTFVAKPDFSSSLSRFFRIVDADDEAIRPRGKVQRISSRRAPKQAIDALSLGGSGEAINIERRRLVDDDTVLMEDIWLEPTRFASLLDVPVNQFDDLLYPMLERECGVLIAHAHETFFIEKATESHAPLGVAPGDPVVILERIASGFDAVPVEWRRSVGNAATFRYRVELR